MLFAADRPLVKIALVGDSTVNDEGGWGPGFRASFGTHRLPARGTCESHLFYEDSALELKRYPTQGSVVMYSGVSGLISIFLRKLVAQPRPRK